MPTNEERREVAARLRNYENLRESFRESPICAFLDALGFGGYLDWKGVCNRLADLIEPEPERTCHIVAWYEAMSRAEIGRESVKLSCGHIVERHAKFCRNCGARVVEMLF